MFCENKEACATNAISSEYINGLYSYALVLTRNHADAEDLVQETYVRAIPAMSRLRSESNMKGWLFRILRNVWFNQRRKRRNGPQIVESDLESGSVGNIADSAKNSYEIYANEMERGRVRAAVQGLSSASRQIIQLREFEELSYQEIASRLDCPAGTVMSRLARARSRLRVLLLSSTPASRTSTSCG